MMSSAATGFSYRSSGLHWADILLLVSYFVIVIAVGLWTSRSNRDSVKGYFLAGRNQHWIPVGASIFASNIGSQHFTGLAGGGAADGLQTSFYELHAAVIVLCLGWVFVPVYVASGCNTMPGYLRQRFGGKRLQTLIAAISLIAYIFTKISVDIYSSTLFIEQAIGLSMYASAGAILALAAIFTVAGGLTAVIWTDFVQTILMLLGAVSLCILSFIRVGGYEKMMDKYHASVPQSALFTNSTCNLPRADALHIFKSPDSDLLPWPGAITGALIKSFWYWCADQVIVQRALAAKNLTHAKAGTILAGTLKLLPLFLLVMPGMVARIEFPETVACVDPDICYKVCGNSRGCNDIAYSKLVLELMPAGARGLMLAVMLAALMSSLTSIFNSSSTLFTLDIWTKIRKKASEAELMIVGRCFVLVMVACSIIWLPVLKKSQSQIFMYSVRISSYFQSPIIGLFTVAVFTELVNEKGAFYGLVVGGLVGIARFVLDYIPDWETPTCENPTDTRPAVVKDVHFLYHAVISYVVTILVGVVISLLTKPMDKKRLYRKTFWTRLEPPSEEDSGNNDPDVEEIPDDETDLKINDTNTEEKDKKESFVWYKSAFYLVCGLRRTAAVQISRKSEVRMEYEALMETRCSKLITNTAAVILITATFFITGFYS